jgi:hypothetical protein
VNTWTKETLVWNRQGRGRRERPKRNWKKIVLEEIEMWLKRGVRLSCWRAAASGEGASQMCCVLMERKAILLYLRCTVLRHRHRDSSAFFYFTFFLLFSTRVCSILILTVRSGQTHFHFCVLPC